MVFEAIEISIGGVDGVNLAFNLGLPGLRAHAGKTVSL